MKTLAITILMIILVLATVPAPQAQERRSREQKKMKECGTKATLEDFEVAISRMKQAQKARELHLETQAQEPPTDAPYYIPLSIKIVRDSNRNGGLTLDRLDRAMKDLNQIWEPVGMQFFIYGEIKYIDSDVHFNLPGGDNDTDQAARDALRLVQPVDHTINVYFTNIDGLCGQSSRSTKPIQGVLMNIDCTGVADNPTTFAHEIAHYFDLMHTHETVKGVECPNGSNCAEAGDLICDTPADPDLSDKVDESCNYIGSDTTPAGCDSTPYAPLPRNLMSYSSKPCRTQFTNDQIKVVLHILRYSRPNLLYEGARYVDPLASPSNEDCGYNSPCQSLEKAIRVADAGDIIFIKPGYNHAANLGGKQVTLRRWGTAGEVNITR